MMTVDISWKDFRTKSCSMIITLFRIYLNDDRSIDCILLRSLTMALLVSIKLTMALAVPILVFLLLIVGEFFSVTIKPVYSSSPIS